jgi:hypothetical protein
MVTTESLVLDVWYLAVVMKNITRRGPLKVNRRFGGTCRLHFQGRKISYVRNQREAGQLNDGFLLYLFFDIKAGGDMFLRNVGCIPEDRILRVAFCFVSINAMTAMVGFT